MVLFEVLVIKKNMLALRATDFRFLPQMSCIFVIKLASYDRALNSADTYLEKK